MRTIVLKLHHPSAKKRRIMDEAMLNYTRAYQYLLDRAYEEFDSIYERCRDNSGRYTVISVAKWISRDICKELNRFCVEPFKDSLKLDFSMTMAGYLNLRKIQKNVNFPLVYVSSKDRNLQYNSLLRDFDNDGISADECITLMERLDKKSGCLRPIYFCRSDINRDYCLLYDGQNNRYFVKIYLMNRKNAVKVEKDADRRRTLRYIHKSNVMFEDSGSSRRFIIVPLSFGKWQESYLKWAVENPETIKTARLMKKNSRYYLAVNIEEKRAEKMETTSVMGVSRGLKNTLSYTVENFMGNEIARGNIACSSPQHYERNLNDDQLYRLANKLAKLALKHKSRVVMASMVDKGDKLEWKDIYGEIHDPILTRHSYNLLTGIAAYKLEALGLPPLIKLSPAGIFYKCPVCGTNTRKNRFNKDIFICINCGATLEIEYLGSHNLVDKYLEYNHGKLEIKAERTKDGIRLTNDVIGLDFCVKDPLRGLNDISKEIGRLIDVFYCNMSKGIKVKDMEFRKKYSLIKRIEKEEDLLNLIKFI